MCSLSSSIYNYTNVSVNSGQPRPVFPGGYPCSCSLIGKIYSFSFQLVGSKPTELGMTDRYTSKEGDIPSNCYDPICENTGSNSKENLLRKIQRHTDTHTPWPHRYWFSKCSEAFQILPERWSHRSLFLAPSMAQPYLCFAKPSGPRRGTTLFQLRQERTI